MKPVPGNHRWAALVRLSCVQGGDLSNVLHELSGPSEDLEVRGCNSHSKFSNIYFAEVADKMSAGAETEWRTIVEGGLRRARRTAMEVCLLGVYPLNCLGE